MKRQAGHGAWATPPAPSDSRKYRAPSLLELPQPPQDEDGDAQHTDGAADAEDTGALLRSLSLDDDAGVGLVACGEDGSHRSATCSERPQRITRILQELRARGARVVQLQRQPRQATDEELLRVHTRAHLARLTRLCEALPGSGAEAQSRAHDAFVNEQAGREFESVYMTSRSLRAARLAAGACLDAVDAVAERRVRSAACAVRPPGHHAEAHCAMGFCLLNNVALACRRALDVHGLRRVLVVDFDVHHGNGTQRAFWADGRVLYASVHRWDAGGFYPHSAEAGAAAATGAEAARGSTLNVAFSGGGAMGDAEYRAVWERVLMPAAREFAPELVLVSAGFDACLGDPIGGYAVTPACFGAMVARLATLAQGRLVLVLEGGALVCVRAEG
jgi:acetoin utilization deacetylase AcuC-like enzyme